MNYSAEICNAVVHKKMSHIPSICDVTGLSERACETLIGKLCGDGTLRRERDYIYVKNEGKAKLLAEQAEQDKDTAEDRVAARMAAVATETKLKRAPAPVIAIPSQITVQKGVPIPPPRIGRSGRPCPWPFKTMEIGDSFAVEIPPDVKAQDVANMLRKDAVAFQRIMPVLMVTIRIEEGDKTVRLWRAAPKKPEVIPDVEPQRSSVGIRARRTKQQSGNGV